MEELVLKVVLTDVILQDGYIQNAALAFHLQVILTCNPTSNNICKKTRHTLTWQQLSRGQNYFFLDSSLRPFSSFSLVACLLPFCSAHRRHTHIHTGPTQRHIGMSPCCWALVAERVAMTLTAQLDWWLINFNNSQSQLDWGHRCLFSSRTRTV